MYFSKNNNATLSSDAYTSNVIHKYASVTYGSEQNSTINI